MNPRNMRSTVSIILYSLISTRHALTLSNDLLAHSHLRTRLSVFPTHRIDRTRNKVFFLRSSSLPTDDPRVEPRTIYEIVLPLPMGLILEEMDASDPSFGVVVAGISPDGQAAKSNALIFSVATSQDHGHKHDVSIRENCICIRDKIMSVNGKPCHNKCFDDVMELILQSKNNDASSGGDATKHYEVTLEIGRLQDSTVLQYSCNNHNGVCIAAKPGESYGFLAQKCGVEIGYECRNGSCRTCERWMQFPQKEYNKGKDKEKDGEGYVDDNILHMRTVFNCIGKVPRNYEWLHILDSLGAKSDEL